MTKPNRQYNQRGEGISSVKYLRYHRFGCMVSWSSGIFKYSKKLILLENNRERKKEMFWKRVIVDPRPTAADFPRRIWTKEEIPPEYNPFLKPHTVQGIELGQLLFVPKPPYRSQLREYMLGHFGKSLVYLEKQEDNSVRKYMINREEICCLRSSEDLLIGEICIYWKQKDEIQKILICFNRSRKELFEPFLDWLTDSPKSPGPCELMKETPHTEKLKNDYFVLYNYSEAAYRFGISCGYWRWWKLGNVKLWRKKRDEPAVLYCCMERGDVVIKFQNTRIDTWYLFPDKSTANVVNDKKGVRLALYVEEQLINAFYPLREEHNLEE